MASVLQSFIGQWREAGQVEAIEDAPVVPFSDGDVPEWIKTGFIADFEGQNQFPWKTALDGPDPLKLDRGILRVAVLETGERPPKERPSSPTASAKTRMDSIWLFPRHFGPCS
jgi:hypothetical protein